MEFERLGKAEDEPGSEGGEEEQEAKADQVNTATKDSSLISFVV